MTARREVGPGDGSRPGDVFIRRWGADGPAVVDCTIRHTHTPSDPVRGPDRLPGWRQAQEDDKMRLYGGKCRGMAWGFFPFVMDLWGALAPLAIKFMQHFSKVAVGDLEGWRKRQKGAEVWQTLSVSRMRQVGRQLSIVRAC